MDDVGVLEGTIRLAAGGDEVACAQLVLAHHAPMVRAAYAIAGDAELAREATQIAWTKAFGKIGGVREPQRTRAWLATIAINEARQLIRSRNRRAVREIALASPEDADDPAGTIAVLDLRRALSALTKDDQDLLAMRYGARLDASEIGSHLGLSASGVRSRLARLLDRLRRDLDDA